MLVIIAKVWKLIWYKLCNIAIQVKSFLKKSNFEINFSINMSHNNHFFSFKNQNTLKILVKMSKKGEFDILKAINSIFSTKSVPN